jgi:hypothetical protein
MLALAGASHAYAQTTTTSAPTNSTATPGGGCAPDDPTLAGIDCRLAALRQTVFNANASLGRLFDPVRFRLQKSARRLTRASALCRDADENRAREQLQRCVRPVAMALARIRSSYGRRIIPPGPRRGARVRGGRTRARPSWRPGSRDLSVRSCARARPRPR